MQKSILNSCLDLGVHRTTRYNNHQAVKDIFLAAFVLVFEKKLCRYLLNLQNYPVTFP
jgi:hypothetical protein